MADQIKYIFAHIISVHVFDEVAHQQRRKKCFALSARIANRDIPRLHPGGVILDMSGVPMLDMSAIMALETIFNDLKKRNISIVITSLEARMIVKLRRAGIHKLSGVLSFASSTEAAIQTLSNRFEKL